MIRNHHTVAEAARALGMHAWTLRRLERLGRIPAARRDLLAGNSRIYSRSDIEHLRAIISGLEVGYADRTR